MDRIRIVSVALAAALLMTAIPANAQIYEDHENGCASEVVDMVCLMHPCDVIEGWSCEQFERACSDTGIDYDEWRHCVQEGILQ